MPPRARKTHARKVGRACSTVNDAMLRGYDYSLRTTDDDDYVTCRTCLALLRAGAKSIERKQQRYAARAARKNAARETTEDDPSVLVRAARDAFDAYASSPTEQNAMRVHKALDALEAQKGNPGSAHLQASGVSASAVERSVANDMPQKNTTNKRKKNDASASRVPIERGMTGDGRIVFSRIFD